MKQTKKLAEATIQVHVCMPVAGTAQAGGTVLDRCIKTKRISKLIGHWSNGRKEIELAHAGYTIYIIPTALSLSDGSLGYTQLPLPSKTSSCARQHNSDCIVYNTTAAADKFTPQRESLFVLREQS